MLYRSLVLTAAAGILAGCATQPLTTTIPPKPTPTVPAPVIVPNSDWENLGVSPNGNILNEIDKLSIKRDGDQVTFRDRKTIFNLRRENFLSTPRHKISLNSWQIDCNSRTYRLLAMVLFDENGRQVASFSYNDTQIKPMPVVQNSASYQQMLYVCKHNDGS
ncbi:surface-adhesin E family protein [Paludibacterium yongneupense]|uniref:surface-adhesin E family protein n=1 Tax=Paludibacterium yongneupense TaxID=400061 RepID=UPI0004253CD1|nr:surface-adhesin E family protein [Paludibacterium yongneupense]